MLGVNKLPKEGACVQRRNNRPHAEKERPSKRRHDQHREGTTHAGKEQPSREEAPSPEKAHRSLEKAHRGLEKEHRGLEKEQSVLPRNAGATPASTYSSRMRRCTWIQARGEEGHLSKWIYGGVDVVQYTLLDLWCFLNELNSSAVDSSQFIRKEYVLCTGQEIIGTCTVQHPPMPQDRQLFAQYMPPSHHGLVSATPCYAIKALWTKEMW